MKGNPQHRTPALMALAMLPLFSGAVHAEDIEVFFTKQSNNVAPNVLFVLDSSGSMNEVSGGDSRIDVLKDALHQVLKPSEPYRALNVGIMNFNGNRSGGIDFPITDINSDASLVDPDIPQGTDVGSVLDYISHSYSASGKTPMGDALYFASSYFSGQRIFNTGWRSSPNTWDTATNSYTGGSRYADNPASYTADDPTSELRDRSCSPSNPRPIRACTLPYSNCRTETYTVQERPAQYRTNTYVCDNSGLECSWRYGGWQDGTPANCGSQPSHPQNGDTWVQCRDARPASSYSYQRCTEVYTRTTTPTPVYNSPITHRCQSNYVVMLTDGEPTRRDTLHYIASRVRPITGSSSYQDCDDLSGFGSDIRTYGRCLPELVEYMARYDQAPDIDGKQPVYTYTIGFKLDGNPEAQDFLRLLAAKSKGQDSDEGEGEYFDANTPDELVTVFRRIIREVTGSGVSFVSPSVNVDPTSPLATSEYIFRPEFTPSDKPRWSGDIVKTRIQKNPGDTVNPVTFSDIVSLSETLVAKERNIYTLTGDNPLLNARENLFVTANKALRALLAPTMADPDKLDSLIQWTRGVDVLDEDGDQDETDERQHLGDSLHTKPILVNYPGSRQVLYATTNDGMLHAFDVSTETPRELFAFIPRELLGNLDILYRNNNNDSKVYGLDSEMAVWQTPDNDVYLYFGMRRGGRNYYAIDVTDPTSPKWMWTIKGGEEDFAELGQTWSTPQLTKVNSGDGETMALIFGGGYDTAQDDLDRSIRAEDSIGRAIYVVDARTGDKLWSAGSDTTRGHDLILAEMTNSIPSDVRIIDLDGNGRADRLYVGDTGGRVWRIDIDQDNLGRSSGYLLADFNDGTNAGNRRFYYPPSVAFDASGRLMVAIGSGYRAHPTETTTQDRFYAFEDPNAAIGRPTGTTSPVSESDLGDITNQLALTENKPGWYINLKAKEKVLAESVIFNNKVVFTTYQPNFSGGEDTCKLSGNIPRARMLALADGRPVANLSGSPQGSFTPNDRFKVLETVQFIPGAPYITFNAPDTSPNGVPPTGGDRQTADLYVGKDLVDSDSFLTERISWQNR